MTFNEINRFLHARGGIILLSLWTLMVVQGCSTNIKIPHASPGAAADLTPEQADHLWAGILKQAVDAQGRIDLQEGPGHQSQ